MIFGLTIGAFSAGKIIAIGRRRTLLMCCLIGSTGIGITLIENFYMMILGRTILGFACGIQTVATPRYIEEYVPVHVYSACVGTYCFSQNLGNLFATFSGLLLPPDTDPQRLIESNMWYFIFAFNFVFYGIMVTLLLSVVRFDSPKYSIVKNKMNDCISVIHQIYKTGDNVELAEEIKDFISSTIQKQSTSVTYKEAFCSDERYKRASWINVGYIIFHELSGINVILTYSNTILENILGDSTSGFNARTGSYCISLTNAGSSLASIWFVKTFGRKILLLYGHVGICIAYILCAIFTMTQVNYGSLGMICFFLFSYQVTSGPVAWLYAAETCCDVSLSVCLLTLWGTVLILSLTTEPLMDSPLKPQGVFFLFAIFSFVAIFYVKFYMAETKGLSEKQKKALFIPGAEFGRELTKREKALDFNITPTSSRGTAKGVGDSTFNSELRNSQT